MMKTMKRQSQFPQPSNPRVLVCGDGAGANIALRFAAKVTLLVSDIIVKNINVIIVFIVIS